MKNIEYKFFWKSKLSNWSIANFRVDHMVFNCGEQYMMYQKAMLFGDHKTASEVLSEKEPRNHKALGRKVENFNAKIWDQEKYELVKKGLKERFSQVQDVKELLLKNKGKIFVEASPFDRIWGIGFDEKDALENIEDWGENLLGKILTELSQEIE